jgi:VanZ family protein
MRAGRVLFAGWLITVCFIVFWPTSVDRPVATQVNQFVATVQSTGATGFSYSIVEWLSNVAMFVPLGILLVLAFPVRWWWAALACAALSSAIEATQLLFIAQRFASYYDIAANSLGGLLGALAGAGVLLLLRRRRIQA